VRSDRWTRRAGIWFGLDEDIGQAAAREVTTRLGAVAKLLKSHDAGAAVRAVDLNAPVLTASYA
jgi:hypothetical protein